MLLDGRWTEHDAGMTSTDPLQFVDTKPYATRLKEARKKLGMNDAVITAEGQLAGRPVVVCAMEFNFIGGSMGAVVGEKVTRAIEMAMETRQPLIVVSCSGGARMMEGTISLMQLAKVSAALARTRITITPSGWRLVARRRQSSDRDWQKLPGSVTATALTSGPSTDAVDLGAADADRRTRHRPKRTPRPACL